MRAALALRKGNPRDILEQLEERRMLLRSRFSKKLFWTNFCLIVPVLSVSIIMFTLIVMEMRRLGQESLRSQADNAVTRLETYYSMYNEESILLSERWELLPYRIDATPQQTRQGIELLRMKRYFDSRIKDVFLCKGTEYAFSSMGLSSKRVHFASNLNCGEESVLQGLAAIECPEDSLTLLFQQDAVVRKGYLMYSYVTRQLEDGHVSIHFVLPFEQVGELLQPLDGEQWYQLEDRNGSIVAMGCDDSEKMTVLSEDEWEGRLQSGRYSVIEKTMEGFGFAVRLYDRKSSGDMRSGLYRMQAVNMALIIAGISLSAAISRRLNRRRMEEIRYLEDIAGGNPGRAFPTNSIYSSLEHIIRSGLEDARLLEKRVLEGDAQLLEKTAHMIFHGMVGCSELDTVFRKLGLKGVPDSFFVCAVSAGSPIGPGIPSMLQDCLQAYVAREGLQAKVFLCEIQARDENRIRRQGMAGEIRKCLHQQGLSGVHIGMSRVYEEPMMIDCAYGEAVRTLEHVLAGAGRDFCGCWEDMMQEAGCFLPDASALEKFSGALAERDFQEAIGLFWHMMEGSAARECSRENGLYARYAVLSRLVEYLDRGGPEEKVCLKECLNMDAGDEKTYTRTVMKVLKAQLVKKDGDKFTRMIRYIGENYSRSDLTFEEVAAAGGIGKTYVSKVFRSRLGLSYIEYLTMIRMERAAGLLRTTQDSVKDIAKAVGYESVSSFRRCFKDKFGMNAADYRKREQERDEEA